MITSGLGRGRKGVARGPSSIVNGKKLCKGPLHKEGVWLPANKKIFRPRKSPDMVSESLMAPCRRCMNFKQVKHGSPVNGYVPVSLVRNALEEIEHRIGRIEAQRRLKLYNGRISEILTKQKNVEARTFERIIKLREELRQSGEVRSRRDIKTGWIARGNKPRPPRDGKDYNGPGNHLNDYEQKKKKQRAITT